MPSYLLLIHVGPVQDFIATARRCRDLWYGSHLLSEASRVVAQALGSADGTTLIFPGRIDADAGGTVSVANKIQCRVDGVDPEGLRQRAEVARTALDNWMDALGGDVFDRVDAALAEHRGLFHRDRAERHLEDLFEFYWVGVPLPSDAEYASARKLGDRLLAARKNTRDWGAAGAEPAGIPKSSLDGIRESVIDENAYRPDGPLSRRERRVVLGVSDKERLCGIGLIKRLGRSEEEPTSAPVFHSSSHMASAAARTAIKRSLEAQAEWTRYMRSLEDLLGGFPDMRIRAGGGAGARTTWENRAPDGQIVEEVPFVLPLPEPTMNAGLDGALLYKERLGSLLDEAFENEPGDHGRVRKELEAMRRRTLAAAGVSPEPLPYYAMLIADGDRMGAAIDHLAEARGPEGQQKHAELSRSLDRDFSSRCFELVRGHGGSLLYAGGDDVMALLPAGTALACARALRDLFSSAMSGHFEGAELTPTLSVGIALVHHLEPLSRVRILAREAEKAAKNGGRNALAVLLKKRGGGPRLVVGSWDPRDGSQPLDRRLTIWADLLRKGQLPTRLAGKLEALIAPLHLHSPDAPPLPEDELEALVQGLVRLGTARRQDQGGGKLSEENTRLIAELYESTLRQARDEGVRDAPLVAVARMVDELRIAELLEDAWNEAFGTPMRSVVPIPEART